MWTLGRGGDDRFFRTSTRACGSRSCPFTDVDGEGVGPRILRSIAVLRAAFAAAPRYDVVHAQDCISANAVLDVVPEALRTVHHLDHFTTPELAACHERAIVRPAAHVCVSSAVAAELAAGWGVGADRDPERRRRRPLRRRRGTGRGTLPHPLA